MKEKLANYDDLLEKYNNLHLHSSFFVRKFREEASPQSPLDHIFSQVVFYDQAKLRVFDSRDYETNRRSALDLFFSSTPKQMVGFPRFQHTTLNRHRKIISRVLMKKLVENILCEASPKSLNIDGRTSKPRKGEDGKTSSVSFTFFD